ncbi:hypothetical protein Mgra_00006832, partial [Meloidogyne graminicola]
LIDNFYFIKTFFLTFLHVSNKWKYIYGNCCENKCVKPNNPNGICINGNGFIQIKNNTDIKYINCIGKGYNNVVRIVAEHQFKKPNNSLLSSNYLLFYYEIKLLQQFKQNDWFRIGLENDNNCFIYFDLNKRFIYYRDNNLIMDKYLNIPSSFNYKTNDIIGCGLVYPPLNILNKLPYIFFTLNGKQIVIINEPCFLIKTKKKFFFNRLHFDIKSYKISTTQHTNYTLTSYSL